MFDKNNKYNNGKVLPFSFIKDNRDEAVSEIAEGNIGLEKLLNYCLDNNIETYTCCSEEGFIGFKGFDKRVFRMFDELKSVLGENVFLRCNLESEDSKFTATLHCSKEINTSSFFLNALKAFGEITDKVSLGEILTYKARDLLNFSSSVSYYVSHAFSEDLSLKSDTYYCFELYDAYVPDDYSDRVILKPLEFLRSFFYKEYNVNAHLPDYYCYYSMSELKDSYTSHLKKNGSSEKNQIKNLKSENTCLL